MIKLPAPSYDSQYDLNKALQLRRSVREYRDEPLTLAQVSQLLWAGQGITSLGGYRTSPSAGALYPLEVYVAAGNVEGLPAGLYKYDIAHHALQKSGEGDLRTPLAAAALDQHWIADGAAVIAIAAVYERTTKRYGERGARYVHMEAGHAAQNICLEAVALDLGAAVVAAFNDDDVKKTLKLMNSEQPLYLIPVGRKK